MNSRTTRRPARASPWSIRSASLLRGFGTWRLWLSARHEITKHLVNTYAQADKAGKGKLLDSLTQTTGWTRDHARRAIRQAETQQSAGPRRRKPKSRKCSDDAMAVLHEVWWLAGQPSGKYLAAVMEDILNRLIRFAELDRVDARLTPDVLDEVRAMSPATIDRYLKPYRAGARSEGIALVKPGQILRPAVHTYSAAGEQCCAGSLELNAVAHCGGEVRGDFLWTVTVTEPTTGWTLLRTASNGSVRNVAAAMDWIVESVPLPVAGVVVGKGNEFIRRAVAHWGTERRIAVLQGPDQCDRHTVSEQADAERGKGHAFRVRCRSEAERLLLDRLWELSAARRNHLLPCVKATGWVESSTGRRRTYDRLRTPYQRLLEQPSLAPTVRARLHDEHEQLNPAQITRDIERIQLELQGHREPGRDLPA